MRQDKRSVLAPTFFLAVSFTVTTVGLRHVLKYNQWGEFTEGNLSSKHAGVIMVLVALPLCLLSTLVLACRQCTLFGGTSTPGENEAPLLQQTLEEVNFVDTKKP